MTKKMQSFESNTHNASLTLTFSLIMDVSNETKRKE